MKRSIFIHIGTHKTGTSSIQKTLIAKSEALKKEGAKYINLYNFKRAEEIMALNDEDSKLKEELKSYINSFVENKYSKYIICCEYLSGDPKMLYGNVARIANLLHESLSDFEEKKIFVSLRKQEQFIQSIYTQYLHQAQDVAMETFLEKDKLDHIKWTHFISAYENEFGTENIKCVPYDKSVLKSKNVLNFFGDFSQIEVLKISELETSNHGYSKEAMEIAKLSNPSLNASEQKILRLALQEHLGKEVFRTYEILDKATVAELDDFFQEDNETLFRTYFKEYGIKSYSEMKSSETTRDKPQNSYTKLIIPLIKEINKLNESNRNLLKTISKGTPISPKQLLKNQIKKVVKRKRIGYPENTKLRDRFKHYDKAVILGSAASINKLDVTQYASDFVITVGNFYEHPDIEKINPKIHVFAASHPPITKEVLTEWWTRCNEILPQGTPLLIEKRDKIVAQNIFKNRDLFFYSYGGSVPVDFTRPVMSPWSVAVIALQLTIYCEIKTTGILGVSHDWQGLTPYSHFYDHNKPSLEYYLHKANIEISYEKQKNPLPKERLYKEYELYQQYETLKAEATRLGLEIYNYDPYSGFDVFEKRIKQQ